VVRSWGQQQASAAVRLNTHAALPSTRPRAARKPRARTRASCRSASAAHTPICTTIVSTHGAPPSTASEVLAIGSGVPAGGSRNCAAERACVKV
jgi:hypothetical protein